MEFEIVSVFCSTACFGPIGGLERVSKWDKVDLKSCCSVFANPVCWSKPGRIGEMESFQHVPWTLKAYFRFSFDAANNIKTLFFILEVFWSLCPMQYDGSSMQGITDNLTSWRVSTKAHVGAQGKDNRAVRDALCTCRVHQALTEKHWTPVTCGMLDLNLTWKCSLLVQ